MRLALSAASVAFLAVAPSYGWALLALFFFGLAYVIVITTGITVRSDFYQLHGVSWVVAF
jgi:hypothetical protein